MRSSVVVALLFGAVSCRSNAGSPPAPTARPAGTRAASELKITEPIFAKGLKGEWQDHGWCERGPNKGGPEQLDLSDYGGWILVNWKLEGSYGGLTFRFKAPVTHGDFFEVRLDSEKADIFPRVKLGPQHRRDAANGWAEVFVSMHELNPTFAPFDHVVLRAYRPLPKGGFVEIDDVGLVEADPEALKKAEAAANAPGTPTRFEVDCSKPTHSISPLIYGIAFSALHEYQSSHQWKLGATARRWGGNPTSRYNWELGNAWNTGADYFFRNLDYTGKEGFSWNTFLTTNQERRVASVLTVPTLGWVARDTKSFSFPVDEFGGQEQTDPDVPRAGNGKTKNGKPIEPGPPVRTSIEAPPDFIGQWVSAIRKSDGLGARRVSMYILDNEPALWHDTHRDVHPEPLTYDELLDRTLKYGTAIRKADPQAVIAGPAEWGWPAYFFSALDAEKGFMRKPDRRAHGDQPLLDWYLDKIAAHEKETGQRLLDVLDLHYYPQGSGIGVGADGNTDRETNALRIRSTRSLWDPTYTDESWIKEPVQLIPRMKKWLAEHLPGRKTAIGEYSFGAERHPSGGVALAEALGRFGQQDLYAAFLWTYPDEGTPAFWAFRSFRNYDGKGATFLNRALPTSGPKDASLFASMNDEGTKVTLVAVNHSPATTLDATVIFKGCPAKVEGHRVFTFSGDPRGPREIPHELGKPFKLPGYAISTIELTFLPKR